MNTASGFTYKISDMLVMTGRNMRHAFRSVDTLITVIAMPIMIMLFFVYVFGGSIDTGSIAYLDYVMPATIIMCIVFGAPYTAVRLNNDMTKGIIDRFRSMPIAQSSILTGHVLTAVLFNVVSTILIILLALLIGFRTEAGIGEWLATGGLLLLFTLAMTWLAAIFGLLADSMEGASAFSYPVLLLLFVSSAFAPTESMPEIVRLFAGNQPMTPIVGTLRSLLVSGSMGNDGFEAVLWCLGILIVSYVAAMRIYKMKTA